MNATWPTNLHLYPQHLDLPTLVADAAAHDLRSRSDRFPGVFREPQPLWCPMMGPLIIERPITAARHRVNSSKRAPTTEAFHEEAARQWSQRLTLDDRPSAKYFERCVGGRSDPSECHRSSAIIDRL
jgi:hypothetical protein